MGVPQNEWFTELDDGKIGTGKPDQFDGKKPMGFRLRFSQDNQSNDNGKSQSKMDDSHRGTLRTMETSKKIIS